jgi:hypothetical protein
MGVSLLTTIGTELKKRQAAHSVYRRVSVNHVMWNQTNKSPGQEKSAELHQEVRHVARRRGWGKVTGLDFPFAIGQEGSSQKGLLGSQ